LSIKAEFAVGIIARDAQGDLLPAYLPKDTVAD
jgi:hypothetical protein